jgi:hypothetical protein
MAGALSYSFFASSTQKGRLIDRESASDFQSEHEVTCRLHRFILQVFNLVRKFIVIDLAMLRLATSFKMAKNC